MRISPRYTQNQLYFHVGMPVCIVVAVVAYGTILAGSNGTVNAPFPARDILLAGLVFDSNHGNAIFVTPIDRDKRYLMLSVMRKAFFGYA